MTTTLQGTKGFKMKKTQGDEWGVYRVNHEKKEYLILPFKDVEEAVKVGREIAVRFGMTCEIDRSNI
jgi:hypothetical protein